MRWLLASLLLLVASPASAEVWAWGCKFQSLTGAGALVSTRPTEFKIGNGNIGCYRFTSTDSTSTSDLIVIDAQSALWCFDPDNTDALTDTSRVTLHYCPTDGAGGGTGSVNNCIDIGGFNGNSTLSGQEGTDQVQNACKRTGPGVFFIRVTVACAKTANDYCQVAVKGENQTSGH